MSMQLHRLLVEIPLIRHVNSRQVVATKGHYQVYMVISDAAMTATHAILMEWPARIEKVGHAVFTEM